MLEIKKAFGHLAPEELEHMYDMPVWLALLAAYRSDGKLSNDERNVALKLTHMRSYSAPKSLQGYYKRVDERFAERFEQLRRRLPDSHANKMSYILAQIRRAEKIIAGLDPDISSGLKQSLSSFYKHVFNADKSFFQYFAFPVISNRLDQHSGKFEFELN
jgi:hypothetical protein